MTSHINFIGPGRGGGVPHRGGFGRDTGTAGWLRAGPPNGNGANGANILTGMLSAFGSGRDASACGADAGPTAGLGALLLDTRAWHADEDGVWAAIQGSPIWNDNSLAALARQAGDGTALVRAYERHGPKLLDFLGGAFALTVVDRPRHRSLIAIDRAGVESLYFMVTADRSFVFASSTDVLLAHPSVTSKLSVQSLFEYFHFSVIPCPGSVYGDVHKLLPGECVSFDGDRVERKPYWRMPYGEKTTSSEEEAGRELVTVLRAAVERSMSERGRAKYGAFLSGGLDSSSVLGLATEVAGPVESFTIGFDAEAFDESGYAELASRHFGSTHRTYAVTPRDLVDMLPRLARLYDEPFGNSSMIPAYFCAKRAREAGVDIMLAGDGGDELFAGNEHYVLQQKFDLYHRVPGPLRSLLDMALLPLPGLARKGPVDKLSGYVRRARTPMPERMATYNFLHEQALQAVFEPAFLDRVDHDGPIGTLREIYSRGETSSLLERMMHLDLNLTLADNDLRKVTRTCALAGVEVRFPMLDDEVMSFAAGIPPELLIKRLRLRSFYKGAFTGILPEPIIRKTKHGFGLPFRVWAGQPGPVRDYLSETLTAFADRGIVKRELLQRMLERWDPEEARAYGQFVWYAIVLEEWLRHRSPSFVV